MTYSDFTYSSNFPSLTTSQIDAAIGVVETMYSGILECWNNLPDPVRTNKRALVENLLVGWYLANMYPSAVRGIVANGGLPLSSKSIGGTSVTFKDIAAQRGLESLLSNTFGLQAMQMILSAPEMMSIYG